MLKKRVVRAMTRAEKPNPRVLDEASLLLITELVEEGLAWEPAPPAAPVAMIVVFLPATADEAATRVVRAED